MKANFMKDITNWESKEMQIKKWLTDVKKLGYVVLTGFVIYYLFSPSFEMNLLMETWNQPVAFFQKLMITTAVILEQIFNIISTFNAGQVLLFLLPVLSRKSW